MSTTSSTSLAVRHLPPLSMLRSFEAVARHQSVTQAAKELNVTQSAVSHQVKSLEDWMGQPLLRRQGRHIVLTEAATALYPALAQALDGMASACERLRINLSRQALKVNTYSTFATQWLIPRLHDFWALHPSIEVQVITSAKIRTLDPRAYDVSVRCLNEVEWLETKSDPLWQGVVSKPFLPEHVTAVCAMQLLKSQTAEKIWADLPNWTMLESQSEPQLWAKWLDIAGVPTEQRPRKRISFQHIDQTVTAAQNGLGMALASPSFLTHPIFSAQLGFPFPSITIEPQQNYWICSPLSISSNHVQLFCNWLEVQGGQG
jgi:LysR family transcriptional regulator, glycine cleavage system transcriptional activator